MALKPIREMQYAENIGNPVFITDLAVLSQNIVELKAAINMFGKTTAIIYGFDKTEGGYTPGIVLHNKQLYSYAAGDVIPANTYLHSVVQQTTPRILENGSTFNAYVEYTFIANSTSTGDDLITSEPLTDDYVAELKNAAQGIPPITTDMIADGAVTAEKIAEGILTGLGTPTASASSLPAGSNPTVDMSVSGPDDAKVFNFKFGIPRGATGPTGPAGKDGVVKKVTTTNLNTLISEGTCFFQFAASTTNAPMPQGGGGLQIVLTDKIIQFVTIFYSTSYAGPSFYRTSNTASASTFSPWSCFAENSDFGQNVYFEQQLDATHFNDAPVVKKLVKGSYTNKYGPATVALDNYASTQFPGTYSQYAPIAFRGYAKFTNYSTKATLAIVPVNSQNNAGYMFSTYVNQSSIYQVMANFTGGLATVREQVDYWVEITYGKVV